MTKAICYVFAVLLASVVAAGVEDGPDATATGPKKGLDKVTEDPSPIGELYMQTIDLRPWTAFGRPLFTNPEQALPMPMVILPRDVPVRIIVPDPQTDSECSNRQNDKCKGLCGKAQKMMVSCDVSFNWQPDGTCVRTLTCTCASPAQMAQVASSARAETVEIAIDDTYE